MAGDVRPRFEAVKHDLVRGILLSGLVKGLEGNGAVNGILLRFGWLRTHLVDSTPTNTARTELHSTITRTHVAQVVCMHLCAL